MAADPRMAAYPRMPPGDHRSVLVSLAPDLDREPTRAERLRGYTYTKTPRCYLVGAGSRGAGYCQMAIEDPDALQVTAVAEPMIQRCKRVATQHGLGPERAFHDWQALLRNDPREADFVLIATQDQDHAEPAIAFLEAGYHVLVEKPMATTREDCERMRDAAHKSGCMLGVCHVLRYTPYTKMIKAIIDRGDIGRVRSVNLVEPVGHTHFAHSYVRGNWNNSQTSSFILMAKCCHDFDWLLYVTGGVLDSVTCEGEQLEFSNAHKPPQAGNATRCVDCAYSNECPYDATRFYVGNARDYGMDNETPQPPKRLLKALVDGPSTIADIEDAVRDGPYGQCVYECDNDQPDWVAALFKLSKRTGPEANDYLTSLTDVVHDVALADPVPRTSEDIYQTAMSGMGRALQGARESIRVNFEMRALTEKICQREVTICGTKGEIRGNMVEIQLSMFNGPDSATTRMSITPRSLTADDTMVFGHWGADWYMMNAFCAAVSLGDRSLIAQVDESVASHMAVFDAEQARLGH